MKPGIDITVDFAFKRVFGHERNGDILISLVNAVLDRPGFRKMVEVTVLNPFSVKEALDDKLTIVDIRAVDELGRQYFIEMQVVAGSSFPKRIVYCWAQRHGNQLVEAEDYSIVKPTIALCFVSGSILFPDVRGTHTCFRLRDASGAVEFCEDAEVHLIELRKFSLAPENLASPMDCWLYVLKNSLMLDPMSLPQSLETPEIRRALEELNMLTQDQQEYEAYFTREKNRRDALYMKNNLARPGLYGRINVCQELLGLPVTAEADLEKTPFDLVVAMSERLEQEAMVRIRREG